MTERTTIRIFLAPLLAATVSCTSSGTGDPLGGAGGGNPAGPAGSPPVVTGEPGLELEPFRGQGFSFAVPRGFSPTGGGPGSYAFQPAGPVGLLSRFQMTYLGRLRNAQAPRANDLVARAIEDRKLTLVGNITGYDDYASALADTGAPGPGRFVRIMFHRHWPMTNEYNYATLPPRLRRLYMPAEVDVFSAELSFAEASVDEQLALPYVMRSVAWGLSIPADEVPAAELTGTWETRGGSIPIDYEDPQGNWTGGIGMGSAFKITFEPGGTYQLTTAYVLTCSGTAVCLGEGVSKVNSQGRFQAAGGVLTLARSSCELRTYDKNLQQNGRGPCPINAMPVTVALGRGENGRLRMSGLGSNVINAADQMIWSPARTPAGAWSVTDEERAAVPPPPDAGGVAICGPVGEKEPNQTAEQASPYLVGQEMQGCFPTDDDTDYYVFESPAGDPGGGYFEARILNPTHRLEVEVSTVGGPRVYAYYEAAAKGGEPLNLRWATAPGQKYTMWLDTGFQEGRNWSRYGFQVRYTRVEDPFEPNNSVAEARPIPLGMPVQAYFFAGNAASGTTSNADDYFSLDLQPGPVTVRLDQVPANIHPGLRLLGPDGFEVRGASGFYVAGFDHIPQIEGRAVIAAAGKHTIRVTYSNATETTDGPPSSWTRPYRLLATQP
jgi:hypothetical protein